MGFPLELIAGTLSKHVGDHVETYGDCIEYVAPLPNETGDEYIHSGNDRTTTKPTRQRIVRNLFLPLSISQTLSLSLSPLYVFLFLCLSLSLSLSNKYTHVA